MLEGVMPVNLAEENENERQYNPNAKTKLIKRKITCCQILYCLDCPISVGAYLLPCFIFGKQDFRLVGIINEPKDIAQRQQL